MNPTLQPTLRIFTPLHQIVERQPPRTFVYRVNDPIKSQWVRSKGLWFGDLDGSFVIEGELEELIEYFYGWLMYHLEEKTGSHSWQGLIWSMTITHADESLTRSMDDVYNAIRVRYVTPLDNGGFENAGTSTTWRGWSEAEDDGVITNETTNTNGGGNAVKLTAGPNRKTRIWQTVTVKANTTYLFSFYTAGEASHRSGKIRVYDNSNLAEIIDLRTTNHEETYYSRMEYNFTTPDGCTELIITLRCPNNDTHIVYYDDAILKEVDVDTNMSVGTFTDWAEDADAIARYGRRELIIDSREHTSLPSAESHRDSELAKLCTPRTSAPRFTQTDTATRLEVKVVGYWFTSYFRYVTDGLKKETRLILDLLRHIITNYCDFLLDDGIFPDVVTTVEETINAEPPTRAGELLEALVQKIGEGDLWYLYLNTTSRRLIIEQLTPQPDYYLKQGQLKKKPGATSALNPFHLRPGVIRHDDSIRREEDNAGAFFTDARDFLAQEITVTAEGDVKLEKLEVK